VLKRVGLSEHQHQRVREFSLGMRQRLGLALCLLSKPRLLILDEPSNGLDPAGIVEMRRLLMSLVADDGVSVFMSSHLLSEVEQLAEHVGVLQAGHLRFQGPIKKLRERAAPSLILECDPINKALEHLQALGLSCVQQQQRLLISAEVDSAQTNAALISQGIQVRQIYWQSASLENLFFRLMEQK
jgi:lantibiotic transport system ATP-binding protein